MRISTSTAELAQDVSSFITKLTGRQCSPHSGGIVGDVPCSLWGILNLKYTGMSVYLDGKIADCKKDAIAHIESNDEDIFITMTRNGDKRPKKLYYHKGSGNWYFKTKENGYTVKQVVLIHNIDDLTEYAHNAGYIKAPCDIMDWWI